MGARMQQTGLRVSEFTGLDVGLVWGPEGPRQRLFCRLSASSDQLANLTVLYGAGSYAR